MKKLNQLALIAATLGVTFEIPKSPEPREETEDDRIAVQKAEAKRERRAQKRREKE